MTKYNYQDISAYQSADISESTSELLIDTMNKVYGWMACGLAITAITAYWFAGYCVNNATFISGGKYFLLVIAQLGLVFYLSSRIHKMQKITATIIFLVYSGLTGLTLSSIFVVYKLGTISLAFYSTTALFAAMAIFGFVTKKDLTSVGRLCFMGLIGIIIASFVQAICYFVFKMNLGFMDLIISYIGVIVFLGLTAYDSQKIKNMAKENVLGQNLPIYGALTMYLDFINLFLFLLRIFGGSRK